MKPSVAIQIVNYKTKAFLDPLLESIFSNNSKTNLRLEVNILDNASGDDLSEIEAKWQKYNVNIYHSKDNKGFGAGQNTLSKKTAAKYLLVLNPDIIFIEQNTIERLIETANHYNASVVGPRILMPKSKKGMSLNELSPDEMKQQPWDHTKSARVTGPYIIYTKHNKVVEAIWVSGAVMLIEAEKFNQLDGFDEKFFLYVEEIDLCRRIRKIGGRVIYNPEINVLHYGSAVASHFSIHLLRSALYFQWKKIKHNY